VSHCVRLRVQIDKGHCKMVYEGDAELEYSDYYDFRPSYPDNDGTEELREGDEVGCVDGRAA